MNQITCINEIVRPSSPLLYRKSLVLDCEYDAEHEDSQANGRFLVPPFHSVAVYPTNRTEKVLAPSDIEPRDRWFLKLRILTDMANEWECREKINLCRQCTNVRDEFVVIVISNRRNKIIFELFVKRSIYRILSKFVELLGYLSAVRINQINCSSFS